MQNQVEIKIGRNQMCAERTNWDEDEREQERPVAALAIGPQTAAFQQRDELWNGACKLLHIACHVCFTLCRSARRMARQGRSIKWARAHLRQ